MNFHFELLACCPNPYLRAAYELIRFQLTGAAPALADQQHGGQPRGAGAGAVERSDIEGACRMLESHVLENEARYIAGLRRRLKGRRARPPALQKVPG